MSQLRACTACRRHVRIGEARCPFCDAALDAAARPVTLRTSAVSALPRLSRAAIFAFGAAATAAAATASIAACTAGTPGPSDASAEEGGGPVDAAGRDTSTAPDTSVPDTGVIAMPYGAPPPDGLVEVV
jgi:hypothetical protein